MTLQTLLHELTGEVYDDQQKNVDTKIMIKIISIIFLFLLTACGQQELPYVSNQVITDAESACKPNDGLKGISNIQYGLHGNKTTGFRNANIVCNNNATFKFEESVR